LVVLAAVGHARHVAAARAHREDLRAAVARADERDLPAGAAARGAHVDARVVGQAAHVAAVEVGAVDLRVAAARGGEVHAVAAHAHAHVEAVALDDRPLVHARARDEHAVLGEDRVPDAAASERRQHRDAAAAGDAAHAIAVEGRDHDVLAAGAAAPREDDAAAERARAPGEDLE